MGARAMLYKAAQRNGGQPAGWRLRSGTVQRAERGGMERRQRQGSYVQVTGSGWYVWMEEKFQS